MNRQALYIDVIADKKEVTSTGTTRSGLSAEEIGRLGEINKWAFDKGLMPEGYGDIKNLEKDDAKRIIRLFWEDRL